MPIAPGGAPRPLDAAGLFYGYIIAAVASFIMVLVFGVHYAFGIFFKPVMTDFGWTRAATAGAFSLVWVVHGVLALAMGDLNDRIGPRAVLTAGGILVGAGFLLMSTIGAIWQLYLYYGVIVGAGLGGTFVPLTSTTARWFVARRGLVTGIVAAGVGIGALIGPPIASALIRAYDWRVSYRILGAIVLVGGVTAAQWLRRDPAQMGLRAFGESGDGTNRPLDAHIGLTLRAALATPQFWSAVTVFFCYGFALSAILLHLAPHATDLGISTTMAANILATLGGVSVIGKVAMGGLVDAIGNKKVYLISFALMVASLLWLVKITEPWMFFAFAAIFGFAYGGLATAHSPIVAWLFGMRRHGVVFGACFNGWTLGCAIGPLVAGYLYDRQHNYEMAFMICAAMAFAGLLLTLRLTPVSTATAIGGRPLKQGA
ncbi:MAG TPA: MFS transporter [Vicinamibacterales bacterium]